jgi:hypothetical protein
VLLSLTFTCQSKV